MVGCTQPPLRILPEGCYLHAHSGAHRESIFGKSCFILATVLARCPKGRERFRLLNKMLSVYVLLHRLRFSMVVAAFLIPASACGEDGAQWEPSPAGKPTLEAARAAFAEGLALIQDEKWLEAVRKFEYAAAAKNTPGLRYYIGFCWERQGAADEALTHYQTAQELLVQMPAPDVEQIIPEAILRVQAKLARVQLIGAPPGVTLSVDGEPREITQELYLSAGRHTLRMEKKGHEDFSTILLLDPGERTEVNVEMPPSGEGDLIGSGDPGDAARVHRWTASRKGVFWSSAGLSAVGLGTGVFGTVQAASVRRRVRQFQAEADDLSDGDPSACTNPSGDLVRVCNNLELANRRRAVSTVAMVGGYSLLGVGVVGALAAAFLWPEAPVQVEVGAAPHGSWLGVRGEF